MTLHLRVHPDNPQPRLINQAVAALRAGAVAVYPTDSSYALGCMIEARAAQERIRRVRHLEDGHEFTLVCRDLSEIATYARVDNAAYRLLRSLTPGPYTFLLPATREVPRRLQDPRRKTVGLRVPDNAIAAALLEALGEPLMSTTLLLPGDDFPLSDPADVRARLDKLVDVIVDGGACGLEPTTVLDLVGPAPQVLRHGRGPVDVFER